MITVTGQTTDANYDPKNHYWQIGSSGLIWSTANRRYMTSQEIGSAIVTSIESEDALQVLLSLAGCGVYGPRYVPLSVPTKSMRAKLTAMGKLSQVEAVMLGSGLDTLHYAFQHAKFIQRSGQITEIIKSTLEYTDPQIDTLFREVELL